MENLYNNKFTNIEIQMPIIKNYYILALITLFCCFPFGIISIVYSIQVNSALYTHNYELAKFYSKKAKFWGILAFVLGFILYFLYITYYIIAILYLPYNQ